VNVFQLAPEQVKNGCPFRFFPASVIGLGQGLTIKAPGCASAPRSGAPGRPGSPVMPFGRRARSERYGSGVAKNEIAINCPTCYEGER
jgi:hypothetical protein